MGSHLKREGVLATMFCSHWFITLFAYTLPFDHLLRVWDVLFLEGPKIIFRCARAEYHSSLCTQRHSSLYMQRKVHTSLACPCASGCTCEGNLA